MLYEQSHLISNSTIAASRLSLDELVTNAKKQLTVEVIQIIGNKFITAERWREESVKIQFRMNIFTDEELQALIKDVKEKTEVEVYERYKRRRQNVIKIRKKRSL